MANTSTATGRVPTTQTETTEAIAAAWVTAKQDETAAGKVKAAASALRTKAGRKLADAMTHGEVVTVNTNRQYFLEIQEYQNVVASKVLANLRVLRPELADVLDDLETRPENQAALVTKIALKPVKA